MCSTPTRLQKDNFPVLEIKDIKPQDYHRGTAGSYILSCVVCGFQHFREQPDGQGNPSWCIACCRSKRDQGKPDGRVVPVLKEHLPLWHVIWKIHENPGE